MSCNGVVFAPKRDNWNDWSFQETLGSIVKEILGENTYISPGSRVDGYSSFEFSIDGDDFDISELDEVGEVLKKDYPDAISAAVMSVEMIGEDSFFAYMEGKFWFFDEDIAKNVNRFFKFGDMGKHISSFLAEHQMFSISAFRKVKGLEKLPQWKELEDAIDRDDDYDCLRLEEEIWEIAKDYRKYQC